MCKPFRGNIFLNLNTTTHHGYLCPLPDVVSAKPEGTIRTTYFQVSFCGLHVLAKRETVHARLSQLCGINTSVSSQKRLRREVKLQCSKYTPVRVFKICSSVSPSPSMMDVLVSKVGLTFLACFKTLSDWSKFALGSRTYLGMHDKAKKNNNGDFNNSKKMIMAIILWQHWGKKKKKNYWLIYKQTCQIQTFAVHALSPHCGRTRPSLTARSSLPPPGHPENLESNTQPRSEGFWKKT